MSKEAVPGKRTAVLIFAVLAFGLWLDSASPVWGQIAAGMLFWGLFILLYHRMPKQEQVLLMSGLIVASVGEVFCSLIWQLYDYRLYNIPHYVPPGHILMFLLGCSLAPRMPHFIIWLVPLLSGAYVLAGLWLGFDRFGIVLYLMFLACLICERDRRLYSTMFVLCLLLEIYGTALGNWRWRPSVPVWGLSTTNPPVASGAFYCVLDFLMLRLSLAYQPALRLYDRAAALPGRILDDLNEPASGASTMELLPEAAEDRRSLGGSGEVGPS